MTPGLKLDHLPQDVLLKVLARLPDNDWIEALPLVSRSFSQLTRLPNSRWTEVLYTSDLVGASKLIDASAFCNWLQPRLAGLDCFICAVDTLTLRDDESLTARLFLTLPNTLTQLLLQRPGSDDVHTATSRAGPSASSPAFKREQDAAPHLGALTRLSSLEHLCMPLHSSLDKAGVESLASLTALQKLELVWRQDQSHVVHQPAASGASLSSLVSLTSLKLAGIRGKCIDGLGMLPQLQALDVFDCVDFSLISIMHATSLVSLFLFKIVFSQTPSSTVDVFRSMTHLEELRILDCDISPSPGHARLEFSSLLELCSLVILRLSGSIGLGFEDQPMHVTSAHQLTDLELDMPPSLAASGVPGMNKLVSLKTLTLIMKQLVPCFVLPMDLGSLHNLRSLEILTSRNTVNLIDITLLNALPPSIESVCLRGHVKLFASDTLSQLAVQPRLTRLRFGMLSPCSISPQGDTWLHIASLFHAVLNRPLRGLPGVSLRPDLTQY